MPSWVDYWNSDHPIYVSERHKVLHAAGIARDFARHIKTADATVLDYGCGEALYAEDVARLCGKLALSDAAPAVRDKLATRVAAITTIEVQSPEQTEAMPAGSFDLIVVNSLLQYLSVDQLSALLVVWRKLLKPTGRLVIADVIPPDVNPATDAQALLSFALKGGFVGAAFLGLAKTALSNYRKLREELGFTTHEEYAFLAMLSRHGFAAERSKPNFGHNQARMTFVAKVAA
ncbi:MAG: class I SAM-dependent methyltransferase [Beijerinckiaceae bacterium]